MGRIEWKTQQLNPLRHGNDFSLRTGSLANAFPDADKVLTPTVFLLVNDQSATIILLVAVLHELPARSNDFVADGIRVSHSNRVSRRTSKVRLKHGRSWWQ